MANLKAQNALRKIADGWWDNVSNTVSNTWDNFHNGTYGEQLIDKLAPASNDPWYHRLIGAGTNQKLKEIYRNNKALFNWGGLGLGAMGLYGLGSLLFDGDDDDEKGRRRSSGWSRLAKILGVGALVGGGGYLLSRYLGGAHNTSNKQPSADNGKQEPGFFSKAWDVISPTKNAERAYEWAARAVPETAQGINQTVSEGIKQHGGVMNYMDHLDKTYNPAHSISPWRLYDYFQSGEAAKQGQAIVDVGTGAAEKVGHVLNNAALGLRDWGKGIYQTVKEGQEADARTVRNIKRIRQTEDLNRIKSDSARQSAERKQRIADQQAAQKRDARTQQAVTNRRTPMDYRDKIVRGATDQLMQAQAVDNPIEDHMTSTKYGLTFGINPIDDEHYEVLRRTRAATDAADARMAAADKLSKKIQSTYSIPTPAGKRINMYTGKSL